MAAACLIALVGGRATAQAPQAAWPQFRGSPSLTGVSSAQLPPSLRVQWTYEAGDAIESSAAIVDGTVDMAGPATDELALAIPLAPLCRSDCRGLCPICGTDLNTDPCDGHADDSDSPFASLKDLFDP